MSIKFTDHSTEVLEALESAISRGLEAIGLSAEGHAKRAAPVDTGRLRNSIAHAVKGDAAYIGTNVEYAPYVELGTSRQAPKPYLRPAATQHGSEYKALMQASIDEELKNK